MHARTDTVRRFFAALEAEDATAVADLFAEDGKQTNPYHSGLFPAGAQGQAAIEAYWKPAFENFDGMRFELSMLEETTGGSAVARYRGIIAKKDGGIYENDYVSLFHFDDAGAIAEHVELFNPIVAARAFGLSFEPEPPTISPSDAVLEFFVACDGRRWDEAIAAMSRPVFVDYESFGAGPGQDLKPEAVIEGWKGLLPGFDRTQHRLDRLALSVDGDSAKGTAFVIADHDIGEERWTVEGSYELELRLQNGAWKLRSLRFLFESQSGNLALPKRAAERARR